MFDIMAAQTLTKQRKQAPKSPVVADSVICCRANSGDATNIELTEMSRE